MELGKRFLGGRAGEQAGAAPQVLRHDLQLGLEVFHHIGQNRSKSIKIIGQG